MIGYHFSILKLFIHLIAIQKSIKHLNFQSRLGIRLLAIILNEFPLIRLKINEISLVFILEDFIFPTLKPHTNSYFMLNLYLNH